MSENFNELRINIPVDVKVAPIRCEFNNCNKKIGLSAFVCKCKSYYCAAHRPDMAHNCSFDYRTAYMKSLSTSLVKVNSVKLNII